MNPPKLAFVALLLSIGCLSAEPPGTPDAGPGSGLPNAEPSELTVARSQYEAHVQDLHAKIPDATTKRTAKYVSDLKLLTNQVAATGNLDALLPIQTEWKAYESGKTTTGFDPKESALPPAARQLRLGYDTDLDKISKYAASEERNLALAYAQQLEELERKLTIAGKIEAALAVRTEKLQTRNMLADSASPQPLERAPVPSVGSGVNSSANANSASLSVSSAASPADEAERLKSVFNSTVYQATRLAREHYDAALKALMIQAMQAVKLDLATAVKKEMDDFETASAENPEPGSEITPKTTPELAALRKKFEVEYASVRKPLLDRYVGSLQTLVRTASQKEDVVTAERIRQQIELVDVGPVLFGKWSFHGDVREFRGDGSLVKGGRQMGTWSIKGNQIVIQYTATLWDMVSLPLTPSGTNLRCSDGSHYNISKVK